MKNLDNSCDNIDPSYKNEIQKLGSFTEIIAPEQFSGLKDNLNTDIQEQNDHLCNNQLVLKDSIEIKNLENVCNDNDHIYEKETSNLVFPNNVQKYEIETSTSLSSSTADYNLSNKCNEQRINTGVESQVFNDQLYNHQFETKHINDIKSFKNICNSVIHYNEEEIPNPVCSNNKVTITSSSFNSEELNNSLANTNDILSSINNNEKPMLLNNTIDLKNELLNGIHKYGIKDLMSLQKQCLSHYINGRDVIFHSYPCVGKSTVCFISVLQRINTSLNECQAIVLVPTLELALSAQKVFSLL